MSLNFHVTHTDTTTTTMKEGKKKKKSKSTFHHSEVNSRWKRQNLTCVAVALTVFLLSVDRIKFIFSFSAVLNCLEDRIVLAIEKWKYTVYLDLWSIESKSITRYVGKRLTATNGAFGTKLYTNTHNVESAICFVVFFLLAAQNKYLIIWKLYFFCIQSNIRANWLNWKRNLGHAKAAFSKRAHVHCTTVHKEHSVCYLF